MNWNKFDEVEPPENIYQELKKFYGEDMLKVQVKEGE